MRSKTLAFNLLLAVVASSSPVVVSTQQSRVFRLVAKSGSTIATVSVGAESLRFEADDNSALFSNVALFTMNNKDRTYRVQSYADVEASLSRRAEDLARSAGAAEAPQGVEFKLTDETKTISGLRTRKLIKTNKGQVEAELWVSSELLPPSLRAAGERIRRILPSDYWRRAQGNPGIVELIMLYGVPLRMTNGQDSWQARLVGRSGSDSSLQAPAGYRKLDN